MYVLVIYCGHLEALTLTVTLDELQTFVRTVTKSGARYELIKNKKSMFFDDLEELKYFIKER